MGRFSHWEIRAGGSGIGPMSGRRGLVLRQGLVWLDEGGAGGGRLTPGAV